MSLRTVYINIKGLLVPKVIGAVATENNFTDALKLKLDTMTETAGGLALGNLATNAYYGDKGKTAYDHSQVTHAPSDANNYSHPVNHAASIITQDASNRFVTDVEKGTWNGKEPGNANIQTHVTSAHAPSNAQANNVSDVNAAALTGGGETALHTHAAGPGGGMNLLKKTLDQTINAGAGVFADITGLTFPVVSGVDYAFHFYITFRSSASTTGWRAGVNCPTGVLDFWAQSDVIANGAAGVATHTERHNTVRDDMTLLTATITANVDLAIRIEGRYLCTQNGTFAARFANELVSNTQIVVQKGSWGYWF